jgi:N-acyl-D-amino-acid deacylase
MQTLLKGGLVVDGSGKPGYKADVLLEDNKIAAIGTIATGTNVQILDVGGLVVAPGFIDTHSHSDLEVLLQPEVLPKIMQGITTEILGQDGISMAPLPKEYIGTWRKNLAGLDGNSDKIDWEYETTDNYLHMIETVKPGLNECYLVPHGNVRMEAMGLDDRPATEEEIRRMQAIVRREMESGAWGLSTGLIYTPCSYGNSREIIAMCKVVAEYDGCFVVHQRSEADSILSSMEEVINIGRQSGVKIHWSHFKVCGRKNWHKAGQVVEMLENAREEGIRVSFDQYPYIAGSTMLGVILPPWVENGGTDRALARLSNPFLREKMIFDIEHGLPGWDNFVEFAGLDRIYVASVQTPANEDAVGLSLMELGKLRGKETYQATFDLLEQEENAVGMVDFYGSESNVKQFMQLPEMNVCTDGILCPGKPHPRLYSAFPRILGKYVREEKTLTLEEAVYKMTQKPAAIFNIRKRGKIAVGNFADFTIFDPNTIKDVGDFTNPQQYPQGIAYVLVNGTVTIDHGRYTGRRKGKVLRRD